MTTGYINSFQSMGTVDGPGVRCVVFMQGCPLHCIYCHNPETWSTKNGTPITAKELFDKICHYKSYIAKGGVTVSGGEALLQAEFLTEFFTLCKNDGIHTALDTSGCIINDSVLKLLNVTDLCLLDIKMTSNDDYKKYIGMSLNQVQNFLNLLEEKKIETWIRHVIVPNINDNENDIKKLNAIMQPYTVIKKVELLPFRKLCIEKYEEMHKEFLLKDTPEATQQKTEELQKLIQI